MEVFRVDRGSQIGVNTNENESRIIDIETDLPKFIMHEKKSVNVFLEENKMLYYPVTRVFWSNSLRSSSLTSLRSG